jgi:histidinol-phosphate aminotransferase
VTRSLIRSAVLAMPEYDQNEHAEGGLALRSDLNEAALSPPDHVLEAVRALDGAALRRYPAGPLRRVRQGLASRLKMKPEQVTIGSGADDILAATGRAVLDPGDIVVTVKPTFGMYGWLARVANATFRELAYARRWELDVDALIAMSKRARLVILGHPNNPTGEPLDARAVTFIASALPRAVILIDETYLSLGQASLVSSVASLPNVVVVGSFSKVAALAGMRVGYGVADASVAQALRRVMPPFPVSVASLAAAEAYIGGGPATAAFEAALAHQVNHSLDAIIAEIGCFASHVWQSSGNFVLMDFGPNGKALARALRLRGIAVRAFNTPELSGCLRFCALDDLSTWRLITAVRDVADSLGMRATRA